MAFLVCLMYTLLHEPHGILGTLCIFRGFCFVLIADSDLKSVRPFLVCNFGRRYPLCQLFL